MALMTRRKVLQGFSALAVSSVGCGGVSSLAFSQSKLRSVNKPQLGIALLGLGYYSRDLLAPALQLTKHCRLTGIITGSPHKVPVWQNRYAIKNSNVYSYDNLADIANNDEIDVIYVVTPTATHKKFTLAAASAGKHVWCEKPMAMTVKECMAMHQACEKNQVALTLGYRMMHEPNTRTLANYINNQPFGPIQSMVSEAGYAGNGLAQSNWRMDRSMGGGALYDMGVYTINGARFMTRQEPISVSAYHEMNHPKFVRADDTTVMQLEFKEGVVVHCRTSVVKSFNQLRVNCQSGWYQLTPMQSYSGVAGRDSSGRYLRPFKGNQQANQMDNDALALMGKEPFLTTYVDGMRDVHVIEKTLEAAKTGVTIQI